MREPLPIRTLSPNAEPGCRPAVGPQSPARGLVRRPRRGAALVVSEASRELLIEPKAKAEQRAEPVRVGVAAWRTPSVRRAASHATSRAAHCAVRGVKKSRPPYSLTMSADHQPSRGWSLDCSPTSSGGAIFSDRIT